MATGRVFTNGVNPIRHEWVVLALGQNRLAMKSMKTMLSPCDDIFRSEHFIGSAMNYEQELVRLQSHVVLENAVLGDSDAGEARSDSAHASDDSGTFEPRNNPGHQWPCHENRSEAGNSEER